MEVHDGCTVAEAMHGFDEYLRRVRGVCPQARHNYAGHVNAFVGVAFPDGRVHVERVTAGDVAGFVTTASGRWAPATVGLLTTSLRSFFRFLRSQGLDAGRLELAVPMVPRRTTGLVKHLAPRVLEELLGSLGASTPRDQRDRAMILLMARLGLRASEVVRLRLEDIDWDAGLVRVPSRKSGHGALLPLTEQVGAAIADYLRDGRPATAAREVFVAHWLTVGAPVSTSLVGRGVSRALSRAGIDAPVHGANLMRHSLATSLLDHGAGLGDIAQVMGHRSLATTRIYAAVDTAALTQVPLPWPQPSPTDTSAPVRPSSPSSSALSPGTAAESPSSRSSLSRSVSS